MSSKKTDVLILLQKLVPGTIEIQPCKNIEHCTNKRIRSCPDIKALCVSSRDERGKIIGGISFLFDTIFNNRKNGIILQRYGQAGSYATVVEGNGINEIMKKLDEDEVIREIAEKTEFIKKEEEDAKNFEIIEAFKRRVEDENDIILVTRKNKDGSYKDLDKELLKIAKEKEEAGKKIRILDESEIVSNVYILGITSKKVVKKIETDSKSINSADDRVYIIVIPTRPAKNDEKAKYNGILAISSIEDDVLGINDTKDRWKQYFTEKYTGIEFIEMFQKKIG